jgi:hypothetical protein
MLIRQIVLAESYVDDLVLAVQDLLTMISAKDIGKVKTEKFKSLLSKHYGFDVASDDMLFQAIEQSGYANGYDEEYINVGNMPDDVNMTMPPDVGDMAGDQAMQDIKADL